MKGARIKFLAVSVSLVLCSWTSYGATWSANKRLTFTGGSSAWPDIAVHGSNAYVVWYDDTSGGYEIYLKKSTDGGATWQAAQRLTYSSLDAFVPAIAVSGSSVYVVWAEGSDSTFTDDVYFRKSADGGVTWQSAKRLTYSTDLAILDMEPAVAVNGSSVFVVWYDNPTGSQEIYFRRSADGGATWQATQRFTFVSDWSWKPAIAVDGPYTHIVWDCGDLYYKRSTNGGTTWSANRRLTWGSPLGSSPCLAVDYSGRLHLAWYGWPNGGDSEIFYKESPDEGATWTATRRLTWAAGNAYRPDIAVDPSGNVYLVWYDDTPGNNEIYYKRSPDAGATWQTTQRLTFNGSNSIGPSVAANSSTVFVVWCDDTPGNSEIYFKHSIGASI